MRVLLIIILLAMSPLLIDRALDLVPASPAKKVQRDPETLPIPLSYVVPASLTVGEATRILPSVLGPGVAYTVHGNLPSGILIEREGRISGTPSKAGTFTFRVVVTGGARNGYADLRLVVREPLTLNMPAEVVMRPGAATASHEKAVSVSGGDGNYTLSLDDAPEWMEVGSDGSVRIVGGPPDEGTYAALLSVSDGEGRSAGGVLPVRIVLPPPPAEPEVPPAPSEPIQTPWGVIPHMGLPGDGDSLAVP